MAAILDPTNQY
nr:millepattes peptide 4 [Nasonia vitripennis]